LTGHPVAARQRQPDHEVVAHDERVAAFDRSLSNLAVSANVTRRLPRSRLPSLIDELGEIDVFRIFGAANTQSRE